MEFWNLNLKWKWKKFKFRFKRKMNRFLHSLNVKIFEVLSFIFIASNLSFTLLTNSVHDNTSLCETNINECNVVYSIIPFDNDIDSILNVIYSSNDLDVANYIVAYNISNYIGYSFETLEELNLTDTVDILDKLLENKYENNFRFNNKTLYDTDYFKLKIRYYVDRLNKQQKIHISNYRKKLYELAYTIKVAPEFLDEVIKMESGHNPKAYNPISKASGLIQVLPSTAKQYNYTINSKSDNDIVDMSDVKQIDNVLYPYFECFNGKIENNVVELYLCIFYPKAIGKPYAYVLGSEENDVYRVAKNNYLFDLNKDHKITKFEINKYLKTRIPENKHKYFGLI